MGECKSPPPYVGGYRLPWFQAQCEIFGLNTHDGSRCRQRPAPTLVQYHHAQIDGARDSAFPSPPPAIKINAMKHKGKATQAALKLIFWTLVASLSVVFIGVVSILVGTFLTGIASF